MKKQDKRPYKQIWEAIAEGIKEDIVNGRYRLGEPLRESELAERYSSSKTPVKEALRYLEGIGFVEIVPFKGARVKNMDRDEVLTLYNILGLLEGLAARKAIPDLTKRHYEKMEKYAALLEKCFQEKDPIKYEKANIVFHMIVWEDLNNKKLTEVIVPVREQLQRYRVATRRNLERFKEMAGEHRLIIQSIIAKDADEAEKLIRRHYDKSGERIVSLLSKEDGFS